MLMMPPWFWGPPKRRRADAHDAGLVCGDPQKRWRADAHDAGLVLGPSQNVGVLIAHDAGLVCGLMLMMLAWFWGPPKTLAG